MTIELRIENDGTSYLWSYDGSKPPGEAWRLVRESDDVRPPRSLVPILHARLIQSIMEQVVSSLGTDEIVHLMLTLQSMGCLPPPAPWDPEGALRERFAKLPEAGHTPFTCPSLRDWMVNLGASAPLGGNAVTAIGNGPFEKEDMSQFAGRCGCSLSNECESSCWVILGRAGWTEEAVDALIDSRVGKPLRIYSQEMFVAYAASGKDPFLGGADVLYAFRAGHKGLEFVSQGWSGWVRAWVGERRRDANSGCGWFDGCQVEESPLSVMGYHVGRDGLPATRRRDLLSRAFHGDLPIVADGSYMEEWGGRGSPERLRRIANHIVGRLSKSRQRTGFESAVSDWEDDLAWLRESYYRGRMRFAWPDTRV